MKLNYALALGSVVTILGLIPVRAYGHGPQIQIGIENNRIVTRGLFDNEPYNGGVTPKQRVYEIPMTQRSLADANDGWYAEPNSAIPFTGPGIATALGGFSTGSILSQTFADGLRIWDGAAFVDPGTEQIDAYRGATHTAGAVTSDAGPFQSYAFTPISGSSDEHKTAFFRLLGDGMLPDTASDDGVYLLSLKLTTDEAGVADSLPYYFLLNKNASAGDAADALAYLNENIVPEPATVLMLAAAGAGVARRRKVA